MEREPRESLIVVGSVLAIAGIAWLLHELGDVFEIPAIPNWVTAAFLIICLLDFASAIGRIALRWLRQMRGEASRSKTDP